MAAFLRRRGTQTIPTLLGILTLVFLMLRLLPGDPAAFIAGENIGEEALAAVRADLGLDQSLPMQYVTYLARVAQGNLGESIITRVPVTSVIAMALPITVLVSGQSHVDPGGAWHNYMNSTDKPVKFLMIHLGYPGANTIEQAKAED